MVLLCDRPRQVEPQPDPLALTRHERVENLFPDFIYASPVVLTLTTVWSVELSDRVTCGFLSLPIFSLERLGGVRKEVGDDLLNICPIGVYLDPVLARVGGHREARLLTDDLCERLDLPDNLVEVDGSRTSAPPMRSRLRMVWMICPTRIASDWIRRRVRPASRRSPDSTSIPAVSARDSIAATGWFISCPRELVISASVDRLACASIRSFCSRIRSR